MAAIGATRNYDFGQKNHWRRWLWNQVVERAGARVKSWPVLYLAGPTDADRRVAVAKGIPDHNLIGIDRSRGNVEALRERGALSIQAEAEHVIGSWPKTIPCAAVVLDFCGGLELEDLKWIAWLPMMPGFQRAVIAVNLKRGRDASSNGIRQILRDNDVVPGLHRGRHLYASALNFQAAGSARHAYTGLIRNLHNDWKPAFHSYKSRSESGSAVTVFDSVVWSPSEVWARISEDTYAGKRIGEVWEGAGAQADEATRRRLAAVRAVRTMRQEAR